MVKYLLVEDERFTAGDLTIRRTGQGAAELTAQAERLMAPYLVDGGFSFQGVAG